MAVGGLVLAVGVLSLVRIAPESPVGGPGTAEAEPRPGQAATADRSARTAATVGTTPAGSPSATSVQGGVDGSPLPDAPTPTTTATPGRTPTAATPPQADAPGATAVPGATRPPAATTSAEPGPAPTPAPGGNSAAPAPAPSPSPTSGRPGGVCLPLLGLCLDLSLAGGS
ncbi:hypothetical protein ACIREM_02410 [Streptomyces shenzhenensis]|uniref:hypothetical protein n=1 Tax=Streptomyces shenzhenensis TaxID=943815 RepID=UPI00380F5614